MLALLCLTKERKGHHMKRIQPSSAGHLNLIVRKTPSTAPLIAAYHPASRAGAYAARLTLIADDVTPLADLAGIEGGVAAARTRMTTNGVRK